MKSAAPLRVLWICHDGDLYGSQRSLLAVVRAFAAQGGECYVSLARSGPLQALLEEIPSVTVLTHKRLQWVKHDPRSRLQQVGDLLGLLLMAVPRSMFLINTIRRHQINIVHTNVTVSLEGAVAAAITGVPHVWHIRELFMEKSPKFHMVLGRKLSRWLINQLSSRVVCISAVVRNQFGPLLKASPEKYPLIYNALPSEAFLPLLPTESAAFLAQRQQAAGLLGIEFLSEEGPHLGYLGRLSEGKGFHVLLEAFALFHQQHPEARLWVAGHFVDAPYEKRIRERLTQLELEQSVCLLGQVPYPQQWFACVDCVVVPSANEPFGRVVIEAMAAGVPCVGADSGGIPELIESDETGWLFPTGNSAALAGLLQEIFSQPQKLHTIRENARRMVAERFNIENQIRMLNACYQSITAQM